MQSSLEEKRKFLLDNPNYIIDHVSMRFPLTHAQLTKYRHILNWWNVMINESIAWNIEIVEEFSDKLFPELGPYDPPEFCWNDSLPWHSIEFVKRFEHLWDWETLAESDMLKGECREHYLGRLMQYGRFEPYPEKREFDFDLDLDDPYTKNMHRKRTREELKEQHQDFHDFLIYHPEIAIVEVDWEDLSKRERMYWTEELVEKYEELWNWDSMSENPSLPWTLSFMKRFEGRLKWEGTVTVEEDGWVGVSTDTVGYNDGIAWTTEMFDAFHQKFGDHQGIVHSSSTKWTLPLLKRYYELWNTYGLCGNPNIWNSLFAEFDEEEMWVGVLEEINGIRRS